MKTLIQDALIGLQMLAVAFGALVLVPILTGLDPQVALFTAGVGTLLFQVLTKRKVPVFLGSSFVFIAPLIYGVQNWGISATMSGVAASGLLYVVTAIFVKIYGYQSVRKLFPPQITGPIIMLIGIFLAPVAVHLFMGQSGDGSQVLVPQKIAVSVGGLAFVITILISFFAPSRLKPLGILIGIAAGYFVSGILGIVDYSPISKASWFAIPNFVLTSWHLEAVLFFLPVSIAPIIEHIGDVLAIGSVTGEDYTESPGLHRTILGDGIATLFAACFGGPANTTYSEVTGAIALTKCAALKFMTWASCWAIALSFTAKLGSILHSIPTPVIGGILLILFGNIIVLGIQILVDIQEDFKRMDTALLVGIVLVIGTSNFEVTAGDLSLRGVSLAAVVGVILNQVFSICFQLSKKTDKKITP